jgi:hypothetical protein
MLLRVKLFNILVEAEMLAILEFFLLGISRRLLTKILPLLFPVPFPFLLIGQYPLLKRHTIGCPLLLYILILLTGLGAYLVQTRVLKAVLLRLLLLLKVLVLGLLHVLGKRVL